MLHKIFPSCAPKPPQDVFKLVFLPEGFTEAEKKGFYDACQYFVEKFLKTPPFSITKINPYWINLYAGFQGSSQSGAADGASAPGRTLFESFYNAGDQSLTIDQSRVNTVLDDSALTFPFQDESIPFPDLVEKGFSQKGQLATLVVILLPPIDGESETYASENSPASDDYAYVATSVNNHWEQVVYRSIANRLGLGDEFEKAGPEFQAPSQGADDARSLNLQYIASPSTTELPPKMKWREYFSVAQKISSPSIHIRTGDTSVPDNTINTVPVSTSKPEFWEGAGGFRTGVFRPAKDCLMRRQIGNTDLPIATTRVPFCYVCKTMLQSLLE